MSRLLETTEAIAIIRTALETGQPAPHPADAEIRLNRTEIAMMAGVFQPRDRNGMYAADQRHISILADAIGRDPGKPRYLDRVTVWWGGDRYYVVDGHHRLDAYGRRGIATGIPCRVFAGTLDEAMARAGLANSKDRLPMSKDDKLNFAWRLVLCTGLTVEKVARATSISKRTIVTMRSVAKSLLSDASENPAGLLSTGWKRSMMKARGVDGDVGDYDQEAELQRRAAEYRERLYKTFGNKPYTDTEAFALALVTSDPRFPSRLLQTEAFGEAFHEALQELADEAEHGMSAVARRLLLEDEDADY